MAASHRLSPGRLPSCFLLCRRNASELTYYCYISSYLSLIPSPQGTIFETTIPFQLAFLALIEHGNHHSPHFPNYPPLIILCRH